MKIKLLTIFLLLFTSQVFAEKFCTQEDYEYAEYLKQEYDPEDAYNFAETIKKMVKDKNLKGLFDLSSRELRIKYNLEGKKFSDMFSDKWRENIINSTSPCRPMGWHGFELENRTNWRRANIRFFCPDDCFIFDIGGTEFIGDFQKKKLPINSSDEVKILLSNIYENIENEEYEINVTDKDNLFHVIVDHISHKRNYICDIKNKIINDVGDGGIEIKNGAIHRYWAKSYHPEWGAFWYNIKVGFSGEYLELINMEQKDKKCHPVEKFDHMSSEFKQLFKKQKLDKFCVWHKGN